jgi:hypothetical protein
MEKVAFVSTMEGYARGGSEELWSRSALDLRAQGLAVSASVREWKPLHARMRGLSEKGVDLWLRPENYPIVESGWQRIVHRGVSSTALEVRRMLERNETDTCYFFIRSSVSVNRSSRVVYGKRNSFRQHRSSQLGHELD